MSRYRKEYSIGAGGMGKVYLATRTTAGEERAVACKVMRPTMQDRQRYAEMFKREAALGIGMRDSGVVDVFECIEAADGTLYLIMELVDGVSIAELVDAGLVASVGAESDHDDEVNADDKETLVGIGRMPFDMVRVIAADVLKALAYVHDRRILHRDIAPSNVMISEAGAIKLADFGVAKELTSEATQSAACIGRIAYQAPEAQKGARIDHRSDLFSVAAMLYELLTGTPPFGTDVMSIAIRRLECDITPLPDTVPDDLRTLVMGLLVRDPDDRVAQTAREAAGMLRVPPDREMLRAQLGARAGALFRAKCARAERHQRKRAIERGDASESGLISGSGPIPGPVIGSWAESLSGDRSGDESGSDSRPVGEDGYRTDGPEMTPDADESGATRSRWFVERPRLALATLAAMIAVLALAVIWLDDGQRAAPPILWTLLLETGEIPGRVNLDDIDDDSRTEEPSAEPASTNEPPAPRIDGVGHLRGSEPPEETKNEPEEPDNGESRVQPSSKLAPSPTPPAPALTRRPTPLRPGPTPPGPAPGLSAPANRAALASASRSPASGAHWFSRRRLTYGTDAL